MTRECTRNSIFMGMEKWWPGSGSECMKDTCALSELCAEWQNSVHTFDSQCKEVEETFSEDTESSRVLQSH